MSKNPKNKTNAQNLSELPESNEYERVSTIDPVQNTDDPSSETFTGNYSLAGSHIDQDKTGGVGNRG